LDYSEERANLMGLTIDEHLQYQRDKEIFKLNYSSFDGWTNGMGTSEFFNIDENGHRFSFEGKGDSLILFFGGSLVWGHGNRDNTTIPSYLSKLSSKYNCINLSEVGFSSMQSIVSLVHQLNEFDKVAYVITIDGINDMNQYCGLNGRFDIHYRENDYNKYLDEYERNPYGPFGRNLINTTYQIFLENSYEVILRFKNKFIGVNNRINNHFICDKDLYSEVAARLLKNWQNMYGVCNNSNIKFISILQPNAHFTKSKKDGIQPYLFEVSKEHALVFYENTRSKMKESKLDYIYDFTEVFDTFPNKQFFTDDCHVNHNGNEVIAQAIYKIMGN